MMANCIKSLLLGCSHSDLMKTPLKTATRGSIFAVGIHKKSKPDKNQGRKGPFHAPDSMNELFMELCLASISP